MDEKRKVEMMLAINMKNKRLKEAKDMLLEGSENNFQTRLKKQGN